MSTTKFCDLFLEAQEDDNNIDYEHGARIIKVSIFNKKHPGVLKHVGTIKDKEELSAYLKDLFDKGKIDNKERAYVKYIWVCAQRKPDIWLQLNGALGLSTMGKAVSAHYLGKTRIAKI